MIPNHTQIPPNAFIQQYGNPTSSHQSYHPQQNSSDQIHVIQTYPKTHYKDMIDHKNEPLDQQGSLHHPQFQMNFKQQQLIQHPRIVETQQPPRSQQQVSSDPQHFQKMPNSNYIKPISNNSNTNNSTSNNEIIQAQYPPYMRQMQASQTEEQKQRINNTNNFQPHPYSISQPPIQQSNLPSSLPLNRPQQYQSQQYQIHNEPSQTQVTINYSNQMKMSQPTNTLSNEMPIQFQNRPNFHLNNPNQIHAQTHNGTQINEPSLQYTSKINLTLPSQQHQQPHQQQQPQDYAQVYQNRLQGSQQPTAAVATTYPCISTSTSSTTTNNANNNYWQSENEFAIQKQVSSQVQQQTQPQLQFQRSLQNMNSSSTIQLQKAPSIQAQQQVENLSHSYQGHKSVIQIEDKGQSIAPPQQYRSQGFPTESYQKGKPFDIKKFDSILDPTNIPQLFQLTKDKYDLVNKSLPKGFSIQLFSINDIKFDPKIYGTISSSNIAHNPQGQFSSYQQDSSSDYGETPTKKIKSDDSANIFIPLKAPMKREISQLMNMKSTNNFLINPPLSSSSKKTPSSSSKPQPIPELTRHTSLLTKPNASAQKIQMDNIDSTASTSFYPTEQTNQIIIPLQSYMNRQQSVPQPQQQQQQPQPELSQPQKRVQFEEKHDDNKQQPPTLQKTIISLQQLRPDQLSLQQQPQYQFNNHTLEPDNISQQQSQQLEQQNLQTPSIPITLHSKIESIQMEPAESEPQQQQVSQPEVQQQQLLQQQSQEIQSNPIEYQTQQAGDYLQQQLLGQIQQLNQPSDLIKIESAAIATEQTPYVDQSEQTSNSMKFEDPIEESVIPSIQQDINKNEIQFTPKQEHPSSQFRENNLFQTSSITNPIFSSLPQANISKELIRISLATANPTPDQINTEIPKNGDLNLSQLNQPDLENSIKVEPTNDNSMSIEIQLKVKADNNSETTYQTQNNEKQPKIESLIITLNNEMIQNQIIKENPYNEELSNNPDMVNTVINQNNISEIKLDQDNQKEINQSNSSIPQEVPQQTKVTFFQKSDSIKFDDVHSQQQPLQMTAPLLIKLPMPQNLIKPDLDDQFKQDKIDQTHGNILGKISEDLQKGIAVEQVHKGHSENSLILVLPMSNQFDPNNDTSNKIELSGSSNIINLRTIKRPKMEKKVISVEDKKIMTDIIYRLMKNKNSEPFKKIIAPTIQTGRNSMRESIMDLSTVENNIKKSYYGSIDEMSKDVFKIIDYAKSVNKEESDIYKKAVELEDYFKKKSQKSPLDNDINNLQKKVDKLGKELKEYHTYGGRYFYRENKKVHKQAFMERQMTLEEKIILANNLRKLPKEYMIGVWEIMTDKQFCIADKGKVEFDLDTAPAKLCRRLDRYVKTKLATINKSKDKRKKKIQKSANGTQIDQINQDDLCTDSSYITDSDDSMKDPDEENGDI